MFRVIKSYSFIYDRVKEGEGERNGESFFGVLNCILIGFVYNKIFKVGEFLEGEFI